MLTSVAERAAMALIPLDYIVLAVRVERLLSWQPRAKTRRGITFLTSAMIAVAAVSALVILNYGSILMQLHEFTEILVR